MKIGDAIAYNPKTSSIFLPLFMARSLEIACSSSLSNSFSKYSLTFTSFKICSRLS